MKITLDLGGTNIRAARVENGECIDKISVKCLADKQEDDIIDQISDLITKLMVSQVDGIGIGVPSVVDPVKGIVYNAANISSWREVHLKKKLEERFNVEVRVNNDCNCFVLGEQRFGSAKGYNNVIGITLGTGVGAGVVINGKLYTGLLCGAGEIGSLPYLDADYESYCSSQWFKKHNTDGAVMAREAKEGDPGALKLWSEFGNNLGQLIKVILWTYAPQAIVIGGGLAAAYGLFKKSTEDAVDTFPYPPIAQNCKIMTATLQDPGLLGASLLFE